MRALIYGLKPGVRALLPGPLYHSAPNSFGLRAGRLGGALVLMPRFEPEEFLRLVQEQKIDTIFMVPTMFIRLLKLPEAVRRKYDTSSLRHIDPCRRTLSGRCQARHDRVVGAGDP